MAWLIHGKLELTETFQYAGIDTATVVITDTSDENSAIIILAARDTATISSVHLSWSV
jgi:uncharacterized protein YpmB